ncbi:TraR/DksA family transcriptional regulator [Phycicoccus mangrovi]|uniref:TraR/DksA family transcriptional regulator n=1 Tax=Phycicoccus mangrovi TaxID=2840470 RepID=UPI00355709ED
MPPEATPAERLLAERADLLERLAGMEADMDRLVEASQDSNADDEHDPEGQTIAYERSQLAALTDGQREHLAELDAALRRVDDGTYGVCSVCGEPIPAGRLEARPTARTCVRHAG